MTNQISKYRKSAFLRQNGCCYYCKMQMWEHNHQGFARRHKLTLIEVAALRCTAEHLIPKSEGGKGTKKNIVAACLDCNNDRHRCHPLVPTAKDYLDFTRERMAGLVEQLQNQK